VGEILESIFKVQSRAKLSLWYNFDVGASRLRYGPEVLFKTCVAMKFDDDDDDGRVEVQLKRRTQQHFVRLSSTTSQAAY